MVPLEQERGVACRLDVKNNVEMKIRVENDSIKKISLIDDLGASMSYNFAAKRRPGVAEHPF